MSMTPPTAARPPQHGRVKRRLAVASFLAALYPPVIFVGQALLLPLAHLQDVQVCRTLTTPTGLAKRYCEIHNSSPLLGVAFVLTLLMFPAILVTLVSGHLALYHRPPAEGATSRRILAIIGLILGYTWATFAVWVWAMVGIGGE